MHISSNVSFIINLLSGGRYLVPVILTGLFLRFFETLKFSFQDETQSDLIKFYTLWTKKESLAKALEIGMDLTFEGIEVLNNNITFEEKDIYFAVKIIEENYVFAKGSNVTDEIYFREKVL